MSITWKSGAAAVLVSAFAAPCGFGQSVIRTILGGAPDGIQARSASLNTPCAVTTDLNGNVLIALAGTHQVVRLGTDGIFRLVAGNGADASTGDGGRARSAAIGTIASLAVDSSGNLYISDSEFHRVRRVTGDGAISTFAGNGTRGFAGDGGPAAEANLNTPSGLAFDAYGNLLIADYGNHVIRRVTPGGRITSIAGTGTSGSDGNEGPAKSAELSYPAGVTVDRAGKIYISDNGNNWIRVISTDGKIHRLAGKASSSSSPFGGGSGDPTIATSAQLSSPTSIAVDQAGNVYFVEAGSYRVRRVTPAGKIASYAGTGSPGGGGDLGLARFANLNVLGIAVNAENNLLIADGANHRIRIVNVGNGIIDTLAGAGIAPITPKGLALRGNLLYFSDSFRVRSVNLDNGELRLVAGNGEAGSDGDDDAATSAQLNGPRGLAFDSAGNLYIADFSNHRIRRVSTSGTITTVVGTGTATSTGDESAATSATIDGPAAVAVDSAGNLFIAEASGQRVRKVADGIIYTVAGTGSAGVPSQPSGEATVQDLNSPQGLALDSSGALLIADTYNYFVRRLTSDGTITTIVGSGRAEFGGDGGPAASAALLNPTAVATDAAGNIYVADNGNNRIRRVGTDGIISTIAGNGDTDFEGDGSPATAYSLNNPSAVIVGPGCSLLIADTDNHRIRRLWPAVDYTIGSSPAGLNLSLDGGTAASPLTPALLPGTHHKLSAPSPQNGPAGTRYSSTGVTEFDVPCGPARASLTVNFSTQYSLTVAADEGGQVTPADPWQDSGTKVQLTATPSKGYAFTGWEGACQGKGACQVVMDGPKSVKAHFAPAP